MRCSREEQSMQHPRNERRTLLLLSLLILLCICYAGENCTRKKLQSSVKQPEQIEKPRRSYRKPYTGQAFLDTVYHSYCTLLHMVVKGVKHMSDMTTLAVRISKEDKTQLMRCAIERDLSASQIIRQLIRNYIHHCYIETY